MTKTYKIKKNIVGALSLLCTLGPLLVFTIIGFTQAVEVEKVTLSMTMVASIILAIVSVMKKIHLKSVTYILMIGLWVALEKIMPFLITIVICTIFDELLFTPLYKRLNENYHTHKEIDKRI